MNQSLGLNKTGRKEFLSRSDCTVGKKDEGLVSSGGQRSGTAGLYSAVKTHGDDHGTNLRGIKKMHYYIYCLYVFNTFLSITNIIRKCELINNSYLNKFALI